MILIRRKHGSQRPLKNIVLEPWPNVTGQGGSEGITFKGDDDVWYTILPENMDEMRRLLSEAPIAHHNIKDAK